MYLSRMILNRSRMAILWVANPYRVHQRLLMACDKDPRLLFRIEEHPDGFTQILVQSQAEPNWFAAFTDFTVLLHPVECKSFQPLLHAGRIYRFRLLANPTARKTIEYDGQQKKIRLGLISEKSQIAWLERKLEAAGSEIVDCRVIPRGLQRSRKNPARQDCTQTHLAVLFEGVLRTKNPELLQHTLETGIGSAKGYGFGLLSLSPVAQ